MVGLRVSHDGHLTLGHLPAVMFKQVPMSFYLEMWFADLTQTNTKFPVAGWIAEHRDRCAAQSHLPLCDLRQTPECWLPWVQMILFYVYVGPTVHYTFRITFPLPRPYLTVEAVAMLQSLETLGWANTWMFKVDGHQMARDNLPTQLCWTMDWKDNWQILDRLLTEYKYM